MAAAVLRVAAVGHLCRLVYTQCGDLVGKVVGGREPPSSAGPHRRYTLRRRIPPTPDPDWVHGVRLLLLGELLLDTSFVAGRWTEMIRICELVECSKPKIALQNCGAFLRG